MKHKIFIKAAGVLFSLLVAVSIFARPSGPPPGPGYRLVNGHVQIADASKDLIYGNAAGIAWFILGVFMAVYGGYMIMMVLKKRKEAEELMEGLKRYERHWDIKLISARVNEIYAKLQSAMVKREMGIAGEYISEKLYEKYKSVTDEMIKEKQVYVVKKNIPLKISAAGVDDYPAEDKDTIWLVIKGSRVDYIKDAVNNRLLIGDGRQADNFEELWKLVRKEKKWFLDEIKPCVDGKLLMSIKTHSASL